MCKLLQLIGILLGVLLPVQSNVLAISIDEIPFAAVNLTANGVITKLANGSEQHENEFTIGSPFLLNCSFSIVKKEYQLSKVIFHLDSTPIGTLEVFETRSYANMWRASNDLHQNWSLNVYAQSNPKSRSFSSFSVWIQPLSTKASANYSCLVWLATENDSDKAKFVSNMFPIRIKPIH